MFCMFYSVLLSAQVQDPVKWTFSAKKIADKTYEIHMTAKITDGWHVYSQTTPDGGPVKTSVDFVKNPLVTLQGIIKEIGKMDEHFEELFKVPVKQYSDKVDFIQKVVLKANIKTTLNGSVNFMTCNDQKCMPPASLNFSIALK
ncbi:MAG: hypothetical protein JWM28_2091 [Chitinophagaceae bacterium]|nr:hypothetical protein [Chitinophagaceae bacterium]